MTGDAEKKEKLKELLDGLLHEELYVVVTEPLRGPDIGLRLYDHLQSQIAMEKDGTLSGAGPLQEMGENEPGRGMWIIRAKSFEAAKAIADADMFHKDGTRTYRLFRWTLNEGTFTFTGTLSDQSARLKS